MSQPLPLADLPEWPSSAEAVGEFFLFGDVPFAVMVEWQRYMAYQIGQSARLRWAVACCFHEPLITVGRSGSRQHILMTGQQLRDQRIDVRWVARGGGCILHGPGQLAVYTVVPVTGFGWSLGHLLRIIQAAGLDVCQSLAVTAQPGQRDFGVWGRSGQLAAVAVAVRQGVSQYGMYMNVNPPMDHYRLVQTPTTHTGFGSVQNLMGCLMAERRQGIKMSEVRSLLVEAWAKLLPHKTYHVHSAHPYLTDLLRGDHT